MESHTHRVEKTFVAVESPPLFYWCVLVADIDTIVGYRCWTYHESRIAKQSSNKPALEVIELKCVCPPKEGEYYSHESRGSGIEVMP